jgi:Na+/citrate or Na+/malate symporter
MTGITLKNAASQVLVDMTMNISQTMGSVVTGGVDGSIAIPAPPTGKTMFYIVVPLVSTGLGTGKIPGVNIVGTTLAWDYSFATNGWGFYAVNARIYYGYY